MDTGSAGSHGITWVVAWAAGMLGAVALSGTAGAADPAASVAQSSAAIASAVPASSLLAIDQNRPTVVDRIVAEWGEALATSNAGIDAAQLRHLLEGMRADHLLAASLAGSLDGLRQVIAGNLSGSKASIALKALGDTGGDLVYTPVTPCRLVETRGSFAAVYQGDGTPAHNPVPFATNEIRNYILAGGNGVCLSQLPAGLNPSAVQLQVFGIPISTSASGDIEMLPQGSTFGSTATLIYLGSIPFTSASATVRANLADNQIGVQVRGGGAHLAVDVVGYFAAPVATALDCTTAAFPAGSSGTGDVAAGTSAIFTAACPTGYTIAGGGCAYFTPAGVAPLATENKVLMNRSQRVFDPGTSTYINSWACHWTNNDSITWRVQVRAVCCRVPGR